MENEFPRKGNVDQNLSLFEMEDQDDLFIPSQVGDICENVSRSPDLNRNENDESGLVSHDHQPRRSSQGQVPRWRFNIDEKAPMTIL